MASHEKKEQRRDQDQRRRQAVIAEVRGRQVNEAIDCGKDGSGSGVFLCECGQLGCSTTIELPIDDYEAVRTDFERFLVAPGHEIEDVDRVVERHHGHLVVVKRESAL
ncbi:MAG TPA: hypothetical protein VHI77_00430 [Solirubrobacterales bacterium]|jgi:hypothetical protein|nr:hypothetical protein [Solirubrobacterales bacterium]